jgi:hypothetical protein
MGQAMEKYRDRHRNKKEGVPTFKVKEADVLNAILQHMAIMKIPCWRNNTGALKNQHGRLVKFGKKGSADITGIDPKTGKRIEIECKAPGKPLRAGQREFLNMINQCCGIGICVHSVEELIVQLKEAKII